MTGISVRFGTYNYKGIRYYLFKPRASKPTSLKRSCFT